MMIRTHLAVALFAILLFLPHVTHQAAFVIVLLVATLLPDLRKVANLGGKQRVKPMKMFSKYRGFFHSFTFCVIVSVILAFYLPIIAFPFFLGYGLHLLLEAWTVEGIKPFWPLKKESKGKIRPGGIIEQTVFMVFAILDFLFVIVLFL